MTISLDANTGISVANASGTANLSSTTLTIGGSVVNSTCHTYNGSSLAMCDAMAAHNIIVNGEMRISQEKGNTAITTSGAYPVDQWVSANTGTLAFSAWQEIDAPPGYNVSTKVKITTAQASLGSSDYLLMVQPIEGIRFARLGFGAAGAVNATLGMWVKCSVTGTYAICLQNTASTQSWIGSLVIGSANTWTWVTWSIPARTTGVWVADTTKVGSLIITLAGGSTLCGAAGWTAGNVVGLTGQTNLAATLNATFQYTGVVFLAGDYKIAAIQSQFIQRHLDDELRLCMRYYYGGAAANIPKLSGPSQTTSIARLGANHPVPMRIGPTITQSLTPVYDGATTTTISGISSNYSTIYILEMDVTTTGSTAAGRIVTTYQTGTGSMSVNARM